MKIDKESLWKTVDSINEAHLYEHDIPIRDRREAAIFIASRQGQPGSYGGMFAPTKSDFEACRTFTGEKIASRAATAHILSEEALRCLTKLDVNEPKVKQAYKLADQDMIDRLGDTVSGKYCCGTCSVAFWRNLVTGGFNHQEERLRAGMTELKKGRLGTGKWRWFSFFWTLSALVELDFPEALDEMRYAAPAIERALKKSADDPVYDKRRKTISEMVLAKV
jgi:hypothetical protein